MQRRPDENITDYCERISGEIRKCGFVASFGISRVDDDALIYAEVMSDGESFWEKKKTLLEKFSIDVVTRVTYFHNF